VKTSRFPTQEAVIDQYDRFFALSPREKRDLSEFLKSLKDVRGSRPPRALLELREQHSNMEDLGQHMTHMQPAPGMASQGIRLGHRFVGAFAHVGCDQHRAVH
jgi:hypothetical protein